MRPLISLGFTLFFITLVASAVAVAQPPRAAPFRSGVDLVTLDVCVTGREGNLVRAFDAGDFLVLDDRVPQRVTFFSAESKVPLSAVVMIDRSSSMTGLRLERAKAAALTFLNHLGPEDQGEIVAFNHSTERMVPFDADLTTAPSSIDRIQAEGQTALFDAVLVALRELRTAGPLDENPHRQAIIVLSDGEDSASRVAFEEVHKEVQRAGVLVYSVSIRVDERGRVLPPPHEFAQLANDSGGRAVTVRDLMTLEAAYAEIATELHHMYRLAYVPSAAMHDGRWHGVSVRVLDPDTRVRTRAGYYALAPTSRSGGQP